MSRFAPYAGPVGAFVLILWSAWTMVEPRQGLTAVALAATIAAITIEYRKVHHANP